MKFRSNLQQTQINKILKVLQNRKLIKAVKSIAVSPAVLIVCWNHTHSSIIVCVDFNLLLLL